ncbi:ABC transporter ATP-binding protein [Alcanivorax sp. JB21]|uniref:ABC transporter ATP-binding protein n=1 Tax=Alcanivorax limicola TaxID=2874102 RepID=UPI001CBEA19E|nr:ABC transporter ATP-binding protein [Alcanivorax limicola]MBZ2189795.1 ABC transporter ATP-binding protein [Alcanivorax limicola]
MSEPLLSLQRIVCRYDDDVVVDHVSFTLQAGQIACLLGPSGCGKTTTLRAIAGLEPLTAGSIHIAGREVSRAGTLVAPEKRGLGMVFQDHALFPHLSVGQNVGFALRNESRDARRQRVAECLEMVRLAGMEARFPHELSGGQQQRVALARALAPRPRLILLDEPFASLDLDLRRQLNQELRDILLHEGITAVIVTHDQEEAFAIATHVGIMRAGQMIQWDSPYNIYHSPVTRFVAEFAGAGAFLEGTVLPGEHVATVAGELGSHRPLGYPSGSPVTVLLRPEDVVVDEAGPLQTSVIHRVFTGPNILYRLALENGEQLTCLTGSHENIPIGASMRVRIAAKHLVLFPPGPVSK